jgi:hypothetical protein
MIRARGTAHFLADPPPGPAAGLGQTQDGPAIPAVGGLGHWGTGTAMPAPKGIQEFIGASGRAGV